MAHYATTVHTSMPPDKAFAYMADLRNFEKWDPTVKSSTMVTGDAPGLAASYEVKVMAATLVYETLEFNAPQRTVVEANSKVFRSYDIIEATPTSDGGCDVLYDATLELNGILRHADPLLKIFFNRLGDGASKGMVKALNGSKVN